MRSYLSLTTVSPPKRGELLFDMWCAGKRAAARFNDFVGSLDVAAGEPLLLPQRFRQNRAWIELKKIWRTKKKVKGFIIKKIKGGYSVAIAGFTTFLPFKKALLKKRIANDRFTIDSINPKRRDIVIIAADQTRTWWKDRKKLWKIRSPP